MHHGVFCQIAIPRPKPISRVFEQMRCVTIVAMPKPSCTLLPALAVVAVSGRDARTFLQGQLTNDLLGLERHPGLLAAACSPEGRVLEILRLAADDDAVLIVVRRTLAASLAARLRKFVLRAAVSIEIRSEEHGVAGLMNAAPDASWSQMRPTIAGLTMMLAGPRRMLLLGAGAKLGNVLDHSGQASPGDWDRACIEDGEPTLYPETAGHWIPQMLNLDLLSALSFTKGCYVGQEIVARTQHLGRIKRRMLRYTGPAGASYTPGQALYRGGSQAAQVVASCADARGVELLAVTELRYCSDLLGGGNGAAELVPAELPYSIPAAAAAAGA